MQYCSSEQLQTTTSTSFPFAIPTWSNQEAYSRRSRETLNRTLGEQSDAPHTPRVSRMPYSKSRRNFLTCTLFVVSPVRGTCTTPIGPKAAAGTRQSKSCPRRVVIARPILPVTVVIPQVRLNRSRRYNAIESAQVRRAAAFDVNLLEV